MSDAPEGPGDPLLRAIAECREEVDRLFDEQAARLSVRASEFAPRVSLPTVPAPEPIEEGPSTSRTPDARPRLDALAKHLDLRRRLVAGPAAPERSERLPEP